MLRKTILVSAAALVLLVAGYSNDAKAHSCLHTRVKCKAYFKSNKFEFVHSHNKAGQYLNAQCFKTGGIGFNVAEAFAHSSQHSSGNTHLNGWGWSAGFASYSWHASHGHCSESQSLKGSSPHKKELIEPPERANFQGAFAFVDLEFKNENGDLMLEFLPGSRLQVDARGLVRPRDESHSGLKIAILRASGETLTGRIALSLTGKDDVPDLIRDGIFSAPSHIGSNGVVPDPARATEIPGLFVVDLSGFSVLVPVASPDSMTELDVFGFHDGHEEEKHGKSANIWEGTDQ